MGTNREVYDWLKTGVKQSNSRISEYFYYDKRNREFFSILLTDYFIFDENFNVRDNLVSTTYSKQNIRDLENRMRRIENDDSSIIPIPRLGNIDDVSIDRQINEFLSKNAIDIDSSSIWEVQSAGSVTFKIENAGAEKPWWKFW